MRRRLLDTDTASLFLKQDCMVGIHAREYIRDVGPLALSVLSCYEIWRGLVYLGSERKLDAFQDWIEHCVLYPVDLRVCRTAAHLHVELRRAGQLIEDADLRHRCDGADASACPRY